MVPLCQVRLSSGTAMRTPGNRGRIVPSATRNSIRARLAPSQKRAVAEDGMRVGIATEVEPASAAEDVLIMVRRAPGARHWLKITRITGLDRKFPGTPDAARGTLRLIFDRHRPSRPIMP